MLIFTQSSIPGNSLTVSCHKKNRKNEITKTRKKLLRRDLCISDGLYLFNKSCSKQGKVLKNNFLQHLEERAYTTE